MKHKKFLASILTTSALSTGCISTNASAEEGTSEIQTVSQASVYQQPASSELSASPLEQWLATADLETLERVSAAFRFTEAEKQMFLDNAFRIQQLSQWKLRASSQSGSDSESDSGTGTGSGRGTSFRL